MKVNGVVDIRFFALPGKKLYLDDMNRTVLAVNSITYGPDSFEMPAIKAGDKVAIRVPTGTLAVTVLDDHIRTLDEELMLFGCPFEWHGAFNALMTGRSGVARWGKPYQCGNIVTSSWPEPVSYHIYSDAQEILRVIAGNPGFYSYDVRRTMLSQCIQFVIDMHALKGRIFHNDEQVCSATRCVAWRAGLCAVFTHHRLGGDETCPEFAPADEARTTKEEKKRDEDEILIIEDE